MWGGYVIIFSFNTYLLFKFTYSKVAGINKSWLEGHVLFYNLFMKGKFDVYEKVDFLINNIW